MTPEFNAIAFLHAGAIAASAGSELAFAAIAALFVCLQMSASGRETEQDGLANQGRAPRKDDVLEFEMVELNAPGGVEWLHGTVVKVDAKKKKFTVVIKNDEEDDSTWNEETYSVRES